MDEPIPTDHREDSELVFLAMNQKAPVASREEHYRFFAATQMKACDIIGSLTIFPVSFGGRIVSSTKRCLTYSLQIRSFLVPLRQ